jgi:hypothetical protein
MAICKFCEQEMHEASGCVLNPINTVDGLLEPIKFGDEKDPWRKEYATKVLRCGDCATTPGNYHHAGCDIEECPRCGGQILSCDCLIEEDDE